MHWQGTVDDLLEKEETVEEEVEFETGTVVVTNRRVLTLTPDSDGKNFRAVERPNVTDVTMGNSGNRSRLWRGGQYAVTGLLLAIISLVVDFGSLLGGFEQNSEAAKEIGAGGMMAGAQQVVQMFVWFGYAMGITGVILLVVGGIWIARFWNQRSLTIQLTVAGDEDDIHIPRPEKGISARNTLESTLFPDKQSSDTDSQNRATISD